MDGGAIIPLDLIRIMAIRSKFVAPPIFLF